METVFPRRKFTTTLSQLRCWTQRFPLFPQDYISIYRGAFLKAPGSRGGGGRRHQPVETKRKAFTGLRPYNGGLCSPRERAPAAAPQRCSVSRSLAGAPLGPLAWPLAPHCTAALDTFLPHTSLPSNNPPSGSCRRSSSPAVSPGTCLMPTRLAHTHGTHSPVVSSPLPAAQSGSAAPTKGEKRAENPPAGRCQGMAESGLQPFFTQQPFPEQGAPSLPSHLPRLPSGLSAREKNKVRINLLEPGRGKQPAGKAPAAGGPAEPGPWRWRER